MTLNKVDLNLFVVFDAIYAERNLTRAAEVLCLTQPAVSNALSRLRKSFNDRLFVRTPQGMVPTPVAKNIIGRVREALQLLDMSVREGDVFNPATSDRTFRISMIDRAELLLLPALMDELFHRAPNILVECYYTRRRDLPKALASGELDLAIDIPEAADMNLCHVPLLKERYVCAVRHDHPKIQQSLSLEQYLSLEHLHISSRRKGLNYVDMELNKLGYQRRIQLRMQHYLVAPRIIQRTNLAMTVPRRWAEQFDLKFFELPFDVPEIEWHLLWHNSADGDQANSWVRDVISTLAE